MCLTQLIYLRFRIDSLGTDSMWAGVSQTSSQIQHINFRSTAGDSSLTLQATQKQRSLERRGLLGPAQFRIGIKSFKKYLGWVHKQKAGAEHPVHSSQGQRGKGTATGYLLCLTLKNSCYQSREIREWGQKKSQMNVNFYFLIFLLLMFTKHHQLLESSKGKHY